MKLLNFVATLGFVVGKQHALAFAPSSSSSSTKQWQMSNSFQLGPMTPSGKKFSVSSREQPMAWKKASSALSMASVESKGEEDEKQFQINPFFATLWLGFLSYGIAQTASEGVGAGTVSGDILEQFLANPVNPGVNEIFFVVFNLLGLAPLVAASLIMPTAKFQKLSATPFLFASAAFGYGALGPFMSTWVPVEEEKEVTKSDLGWFTANVLENKLFSTALSILGASSFVSGGNLIEALASDAQGTINGFFDLTSHAAIALVSTCDLSIITITLAYVIYEDLILRGEQDKQKAIAISASSILLPIVGAALYCVSRPSLPEKNE